MGEFVERKLFMIKSTLSVHPQFYVSAKDIMDATEKAKKIVDYFHNEKVVVTVSTIDIKLLDWI